MNQQLESSTSESCDSKPHREPIKPERKFLQKTVQALIQWMPLGGSSWLFFGFLLRQDWLQAFLLFPITVVSAIWAAYTENFIARLREIFGDRGKRDAESLVTWIDTLDQAIRWQLSGFETKYLKAQGDECLYSEIEGYQKPDDIKTLMLEEVFIPLELSSSFSKDPTGTVVSTQLGSQTRYAMELFAKQAETGSLPIWEFLAWVRHDNRYRSIAIQAWGGYGKTTLLKHVTYTFAKKSKIARYYGAPKLVPFLLYLRKWRDVLTEKNPPDLPELITKYHIPSLPDSEGLVPPPHWVKNLLKQGDALVMLDGFDEVAEGQRQSVSHWISQQIKIYPQSVFIITSRPGGYKDYVAEKPKTPLFIKPFSEKQCRDFIEKWYLCQEQHSRSQSKRHASVVRAIAAQKATDLLQQIAQRPELAAMAKNPLLLNMIATFHKFYQGSELPQRRTELYQEICKLQLGDRPSARRIEMPLPAKESQQVLQGIALDMMLQNLTSISHGWLMISLWKYLDEVESTVDPGMFLSSIIKVSELLVEREPGEYEFAHLSFQAFLAAGRVKEQNQETLLLQHFEESWWRETILLYAAQANPTNLLREACKRGTSGAVSLAYDCLRELPKEKREKISPTIEAELKSLEPRLQDLRYRDLENFLKHGQWQKADEETYRLMIKIVGKEEGQWFDPEDLYNFPCEDLQQIDWLWVKYSNGKFGFSIQKKIYLDCGGIPDGKYYDEAWKTFCDRVGWRNEEGYIRYSDVTFNTSAPVGHLPDFLVCTVVGGGVGGSLALALRLEQCNL